MSGRIGLAKTAGMVCVAPEGLPSLPMMETVGREAIVQRYEENLGPGDDSGLVLLLFVLCDLRQGGIPTLTCRRGIFFGVEKLQATNWGS